MIKRYTLAEMSELWSEQAKFESWLKVELAICEAWAQNRSPNSSRQSPARACGLSTPRISQAARLMPVIRRRGSRVTIPSTRLSRIASRSAAESGWAGCGGTAGTMLPQYGEVDDVTVDMA